MLTLRTLGGLSLEQEGRPLAGQATQRARLALLAVLATERSVSRDRLLLLFWPDSDSEHARGALKQALYAIRRGVGEQELTLGTSELSLNPAVIRSDVEEFEGAIRAGDDRRAVKSYAGAFLTGVHLRDALPFERWVDDQQQRLEGLHRAALERLARTAQRDGQARVAVNWWRRLTVAEPLSSAAATSLMNALVAAGDAPAALQHAEQHAAFVRRELETAPDSAVTELVGRIRANAAAFEPNGKRAATAVAPAADQGSPAVTQNRPSIEHARSGRRARRFASLAVAGMLLAILTSVATRVRGRPPLAGEHVIVAPFVNLTGDKALDGIGLVASDWITQGIVRTGFSDVVTSLDGQRAARLLPRLANDTAASASALALARELNVRTLVAGSFHRSGGEIAFQTQIIDARSGAVLRALDGVSGNPGDLHPVLDKLSQRVLGALGTVVNERLVHFTRGTTPPPDFEAYQLFSEGMAEFGRAAVQPGTKMVKTYLAAADLFKAAAARDSMFTLPLIWVWFAYRNAASFLPGPDRPRAQAEASLALRTVEQVRHRLAPVEQHMADYVIARHTGDTETAYSAAKAVVSNEPDSDWQYKYAQAAFGAGRLREAADALARIDPDRGWIREWPWYWRTYAHVLHELGDCKRQVQVLTEGQRRFGGQIISVFDLITAHICAGSMSTALALVDSTMVQPGGWLPRAITTEMRAHGHHTVADSLTRVFLERVLAPGANLANTTEKRLQLGGYLYNAGRLDEARSVLLAVDAEPGNPFKFFTYSLLLWIATRQNNHAEAEQMMARLEQLKTPQLPFVLAQNAVLRGQREQAVEILLKAAQQNAPFLTLHSYPELIQLGLDPRIQRALNRQN